MSEFASSERRLAAILAADVVGYSRMMAANEAGTIAELKKHRESLFDPSVAAHRGRIVKLMGDGTLVEFASVVDAVKCALAIQQAIEAQPRAGRERIVLRIGVNLGDVVIDGDDIYGDGVNVAARLEPLADPGGICISAIVHESVGNRVDAVFQDTGEVSVKNIDRPMRIWKWRPGGQPAFAGTGKPELEAEQASVAVLPFTNMSGDTEQEYFADGITEDIITDLSKISGLLVIARNSTFTYKGKSVDIRTVGRNLGVSAVLEGSIRRAGNRIRINAQLINAGNGAHLWADRFDREISDIFAVQDEVTHQIVAALKVKLRPEEAERFGAAPTANLEAHDLFLRGREILDSNRRTKETFHEVVSLLSRAIALDPDYAEPYAGLAMAHNLDFQNRWTGAADPQSTAIGYSATAIQKGPEVPYVHYVEAVMTIWSRDLDRARAEAETALALSPNYAAAFSLLGLIETYAGNPLAGIERLERGMRLDPAFTHQTLHFLGTAHLIAGKYEAAAAAFRERIRMTPKTDLSRGLLISTLGHLGDIEEARRVHEELKALGSNYSFSRHIGRLPLKNPADAERIREGYAKTGLPD